MINIFSFSAMALYLGAWILLLRALSSQKKSASRPFEIMLTYLAVMAHGLTLAPPILLEETPNLALGTTLSLIVFLIVTLFLFGWLISVHKFLKIDSIPFLKELLYVFTFVSLFTTIASFIGYC